MAAICSTHGEMRDVIINAIQKGLENRELTVLAHEFPTDLAALDYLDGRRLDVRELRRNPSFLLTPIGRLMPGRGRTMDVDQAVDLNDNLLSRASNLGLRGVNLVCMGHHSHQLEGREEAWFALEAWFHRAHISGVRRVCVYHAEDLVSPISKHLVELNHHDLIRE